MQTANIYICIYILLLYIASKWTDDSLCSGTIILSTHIHTHTLTSSRRICAHHQCYDRLLYCSYGLPRNMVAIYFDIRVGRPSRMCCVWWLMNVCKPMHLTRRADSELSLVHREARAHRLAVAGRAQKPFISLAIMGFFSNLNCIMYRVFKCYVLQVISLSFCGSCGWITYNFNGFLFSVQYSV